MQTITYLWTIKYSAENAVNISIINNLFKISSGQLQNRNSSSSSVLLGTCRIVPNGYRCLMDYSATNRESSIPTDSPQRSRAHVCVCPGSIENVKFAKFSHHFCQRLFNQDLWMVDNFYMILISSWYRSLIPYLSRELYDDHPLWPS